MSGDAFALPVTVPRPDRVYGVHIDADGAAEPAAQHKDGERKVMLYQLSVAFLDVTGTDAHVNVYNRANSFLSGGNLIHTDLHFHYTTEVDGRGWTCSVGTGADDRDVLMSKQKAYSREGWQWLTARVPFDQYNAALQYCWSQRGAPYNNAAYKWFWLAPVWMLAQTREHVGRAANDADRIARLGARNAGHVCSTLVARALHAGGLLPHGDEVDVRELHAGHLFALLTQESDAKGRPVWRRAGHVIHEKRAFDEALAAAEAMRVAKLPPVLREWSRRRSTKAAAAAASATPRL